MAGSLRARMLAMQTRFELSQPKMCLYCACGWLGFDMTGQVAAFCAYMGHQPKTPKTVKGWKVPDGSFAMVCVPLNAWCEHFNPAKLGSKKAELLDVLGMFDEKPGMFDEKEEK